MIITAPKYGSCNTKENILLKTKDDYDKYRSEHNQQYSDYGNTSGRNYVLGENIMRIK